MIIKIKSYPALNGDSFLISFGTDKQRHILIDCGYVDTYLSYIKKDLISIAKNEECIDKLIITHIDSDHIQGAIKLLEQNNEEKFIDIKEVWHNSYRHLIDQKSLIEENNSKTEIILNRITQRGNYQDVTKIGENKVSAEQGTTVGAKLLEGMYSWNSDFGKQAACIENNQIIEIDQESNIHLLSPNKTKLNKLLELWRKELKKFGVNYSDQNSHLYDDAFEMFMTWEKIYIRKGERGIAATDKSFDELLKEYAEEDDTATNGSSIAFILNIQDRKLLFLGDAHPDLITKSLDDYKPEETIHFDLIKVSHHGSIHNTSKRLLAKIDSGKYLISTNGSRHNHPDKSTIAQIVGRGVNLHRTLFFNYKTTNSEFFNRRDWMEQYNYSISYLNNEFEYINI
jgi:beta-lactamase superfamily II metal-dependent hydrolase